MRLLAEATDANGNEVAAAEFSWSSSDTRVAPVDASGLVTAANNGTATITARAGGVSGSAAVTVAQVVSAVNVSPDTATVVEGDTLRLAATAADANSHTVAAAEFSWESSDTLVARVYELGLVTGVAEGAVAVTASAFGVTGRAELMVSKTVPTTVAVSPDTVRFTALGQTVELAAEVRDQVGRVVAGATVAWSSGDTLVAVVDSAGVVTGTRNGETTISATAGEAAGIRTTPLKCGCPGRGVASRNSSSGENRAWVSPERSKTWIVSPGPTMIAAGMVDPSSYKGPPSAPTLAPSGSHTTPCARWGAQPNNLRRPSSAKVPMGG